MQRNYSSRIRNMMEYSKAVLWMLVEMITGKEILVSACYKMYISFKVFFEDSLTFHGFFKNSLAFPYIYNIC